MTTQQWVAVLRRRWYVLAVVMLCAAVGTLAVHKRPITYQGCDGLYVSAPPLPWQANVYLDTNPALAMTTNLVTQRMMSQPMQQQLRTEGVLATYQVLQTNSGSSRFPSYIQPTLQVCSSSRDPRAILSTTEKVTARFRTVLYAFQAQQHVPKKSFITATIVAKTIPLPVIGRPTQAEAALLLIGLIGGAALTVWVDPLLGRSRLRQAPSVRRRRRAPSER
ncbi:MAG TPA: hypothetical protein VMV92_38815 [Streptosporangiaceae bacterium]|nr:hypothetical protein [Streptosporangiaceae bacterium]